MLVLRQATLIVIIYGALVQPIRQAIITKHYWLKNNIRHNYKKLVQPIGYY
jgi:hypothetical protein